MPADLVTTQILENGPRFIVVKFTNLSDGTGESHVTKIDATSSGPYGVTIGNQTYYPGTHLKIVEIKYSTASMAIRVQWHSVTSTSDDVDCLILQATDHWRFLDERGGFGGLSIPQGNTVALNGSIDFTTVGAANNSSYTIVMKLVKGIPQS